MAIITGTAGDDTLPGTFGDDTINALEGNDSATGGGGNDTIDGGDGDDQLDGGDDNDILYGGAGTDSLTGGAGADILDGGAGVDTLSGGDGNDVMTAFGGDSANGGNGEDILILTDSLGTSFDGGADDDSLTFDYRTSGAALDADLTFLFAGLSGSLGSATITSFERIAGTIYGGALADRIIVGRFYTGGVTMLLGDGNDTATGGSGADDIDGGSGDDALQGDEGADQLRGGAGDDLIQGGEGSDQISDTGDLGTLYGDGGDDTITLGAMTGGQADGGSGTDHLRFDMRGLTTGITLSLNASGGFITGIVGGVGVEGFETLDSATNYTTGLDDVVSIGAGFTGSAIINAAGGNDNVTGGSGADTLTGGNGDDMLDGGAGADTLMGGLGKDNYFVDNAGDVVTELAGGGIDTVTTTLNTYTLGANVENLIVSAASGQSFGNGNEIDNVLTLTTSTSSVLRGFGGNDTINGSASFDQLFGGTGNDIIDGNGGSDVIYGEEGANILRGGAGNDQIITYIGSTDTIDGGADTDTLFVWFAGAAASRFELANVWGGGTGTINGSSVTGIELLSNGDWGTAFNDLFNIGAGYTGALVIDAKGGRDTIVGGMGNDTLSGGDGNDTIDGGGLFDTLNGGNGNDVIISWGGDTIDGGAGRDGLGIIGAEQTLVVDLSALWTGGTGYMMGGTVVGIEYIDGTIQGSNGNDTIIIGAAYTEDLTVNLGGGSDRFTSGSGNDTITTDDTFDFGNDVVFAGDGEDSVVAHVGDDEVHGEGGNDSIVGGAGADSIYGDAGDDYLLGDAFFDEWGGGSDLVRGGLGNDTIYGADFSDTLYGDAGDDFIYGDSVPGIAYTGNDTIFGGAGNDMLSGDNGDDSVDGGTGNDTISGGAGKDVLRGRNGLDTLDGGASNDRLIGGAGRDDMTGGAGKDVFVWSDGDFAGRTVNAADRIRDFVAGADRIDLSAVDAVAGGADNAFAFIGAATFTGVAGQLRYVVSGADTLVQGDTDGNGVADVVIRLDGVVTLSAGDFTL